MYQLVLQWKIIDTVLVFFNYEKALSPRHLSNKEVE